MKKVGGKFFIIGAVLVLIGAVLPVFRLQIDDIQIAPFIFSLGVAGVLIGRYTQPISGDHFRIRRLRFQQTISSCLLALSAYLMFMEDKKWVLALFVAAVIDLIIIFRLPEKES